MRDRLTHAYPLGRLDPLYAPFCRWYAARGADDELREVLLWYQGLSIPVAFLVSAPDGDARSFFEAACSLMPARFYFHILGGQLDALREACIVASSTEVERMGLERADYLRVALDPSAPAPRRLGHRDTAAIMALYAHDPDHFFEPYQLETGLYFGVDDPRGPGLACITGVHSASVQHDVGVVGNLVTHPAMRGRGLATACTRVMLDHLFERVSLAALNVEPDNAPAVRVYSKLGFTPHSTYFEGHVES